MRIGSIQLSNILSFPYVEDIDEAVKVSFDPSLNIIIGSNGSGKSTMLEAINFLFKRVIFRPYIHDENVRNNTTPVRRLETLRPDPAAKQYRDIFRLSPNWSTETKKQTIKIELFLDDVDRQNIETIIQNYEKISYLASRYSRTEIPEFNSLKNAEQVTLTIALDDDNDSFEVTHSTREDLFAYLYDYELIKEIINMYNIENTLDRIPLMGDSFTMLSAFRNYHSFTNDTTLNTDADFQIRGLRQGSFSRSINAGETGEPTVFSLVRLRAANVQYELSRTKMTDRESENEANKIQMIKNINNKIAIINLNCRIKLLDRRNWSYIFEFFDTKHNKPLGSINSLSAGQRSIIHLVFEAYGRDEVKGGVVIVDEPEIHLHYQFQHEYLKIMNDIIKDQATQYILVTHSDGFIDHTTAPYLKRFALNKNRESVVYSPLFNSSQDELVRILDNKQSARVLFSNKVILVEGQDDRFFYRALLDKLHPGLRKEISVFDVGGRDDYVRWIKFFESYGLIVYCVKDLDAAFVDIYNIRSPYKLTSETSREKFKKEHTSLPSDIKEKYDERLYILSEGAVEEYTDTDKGLKYMMEYCMNIDQFIEKDTDKSNEVIGIIEEIII